MTAQARRVAWLVGAALSLGAGVIHFALGPEHVEELGALGYGFYLSGALQVGWALVVGALLLPGPARAMAAVRSLAVTGLAINVAILAAWTFSRVVGLPAGDTPWTPEAIGRPDAIAGVLEAGLVVGLLGSLRNWSIGRLETSRWLAASAGVALSVVIIGTAFAILPDATGHDEGHEHAAGAMVMTVDAGEPR